MQEGEELVEEPFQRLIARDELRAYRYDGFWQAMDTFKDRQRLEQLYAEGHAPWEVWKTSVAGEDRRSSATRTLLAPADAVPLQIQ